MNRTIIVVTQSQSEMLCNTLAEYNSAKMLLSDLVANAEVRCPATVVRLPRRLFRGRMRSYNNTWMLKHGARLGSVL